MFNVTIVGGGDAHQRTETGTKPSDKNESCNQIKLAKRSGYCTERSTYPS